LRGSGIRQAEGGCHPRGFRKAPTRVPTDSFGVNGSVVEIANIPTHGLWLFAHGEELFMSFEDLPWFKDKTIGSIFHVEEPAPGHFHWPELDVGLTKEMIEHPERFPLKAKESG